MNIKSVIVNGLFHTFNHEIRFNNGNIAIIIGENGIGKTTILQIINSIFSKNFEYLYTIDFNEIIITFTNDTWKIAKGQEDSLTIKKEGAKPFIVKSKRNQDNLWLRRYISQINDNEWFDRRIGMPISREEIIQRYGKDPLEGIDNFPNWFNDAVKNNHVIYIKTQRLYRTEYERERDVRELEYMVKAYSKELVKLLQEIDAQFTTTSIQLDSTFPVRLLTEVNQQKSQVTPKYINGIIEDIKRLNTYRALLSSVGIIDKQDDDFITNSLGTLNDTDALSILNLYINDNKQKLEVFSHVAKKLEIMLRLINKRFKHKTISVDKKSGFIIKSNYEDREIDIEKLSSGEQNELIIFYNLLFKTSNNDIVLIDEPEISLHIAWQQQLINDLKEIAKETGISLLISTHSPDIIGDNWSLVQTLSSKE